MTLHRNPAFTHTRRRLAGFYAGTMGVILSLCGLGFYLIMAQTQWQALNRKLATVAGTLHDGIEPALTQPGTLPPIVEHLLPGLSCHNQAQCPPPIAIGNRHLAGVVQQTDYYVRFLDSTSTLLATAGQPPPALAPNLATGPWQTLTELDGPRYRQITLFLKTQTQAPWGYLQVGQSLSSYDSQRARLGWMLALGLPTAMLLVAGASWWLSGLAMQPIAHAYRQMQQFTADAAHELRTPLAVMRSTVEFTLTEPILSDPEARHSLRIIERQNQRLTTLVQDLLLLSRLDLQPVPVPPSRCCLVTLVQDLAEEFAALAIAANLTLTLAPPLPAALTIDGSPDDLYRLGANLITNAIQYTPAGGTITLWLHATEQAAILEIQDTGVGIPAADLPHICDRFYRVNADRARHTGGSGLGLAIVQAIVHAHHGTLTVHSVVGQGSLFTVRLPRKRSNA